MDVIEGRVWIVLVLLASLIADRALHSQPGPQKVAGRMEVAAPDASFTLDAVAQVSAQGGGVALAPDARSVIYVQGAPWPRLARYSLADRSSRLLANSVPVLDGSIRFDRKSGEILASLFVGSIEEPSTRVPARSSVVAVDPATGKTRVLVQSAAKSIVLLDAARDGALLVGLCPPLKGTLARTSAQLLDIHEWKNGRLAPIAAISKVRADTRIAYSMDEAAIEWNDSRFVRATNKVELREGGFTKPLRGDLPTYEVLRFHLGSFGDDPHVETWVRVGGSASALRFPQPSDRRFDAVEALSFVGSKVLYRQGAAKFCVASWKRGLGADDSPKGHEAEKPGLCFSDVVDGGDAQETPPENDLRRKLNPKLEPLPQTCSMRLERRDVGALLSSGSIEVTEAIDGRIRIVHRLLVGVDEIVASQIGFDGERAWLVEGLSTEKQNLDLRDARRELQLYSAYRLFLDPMRLLDSRGKFSKTRFQPDSPREIPVAYRDGYSCVLRLGKDLLPTSIERDPRRKNSSDARRLEFSEWRTEGDFLVPGKLAFRGKETFDLELVELSFDTAKPADFEALGPQAARDDKPHAEEEN